MKEGEVREEVEEVEEGVKAMEAASEAPAAMEETSVQYWSSLIVQVGLMYLVSWGCRVIP